MDEEVARNSNSRKESMVVNKDCPHKKFYWQWNWCFFGRFQDLHMECIWHEFEMFDMVAGIARTANTGRESRVVSKPCRKKIKYEVSKHIAGNWIGVSSGGHVSHGIRMYEIWDQNEAVLAGGLNFVSCAVFAKCRCDWLTMSIRSIVSMDRVFYEAVWFLN